jgi:hypothetical protein
MKLPSWKNAKPSNKVYWLRIPFGLLAGVICSPFVLGLDALFGAILGFIVYASVYYLITTMLKIDEKAVGGMRKLLTIGVGSYIMVWILTWTVLNTVAMAPALI